MLLIDFKLNEDANEDKEDELTFGGREANHVTACQSD